MSPGYLRSILNAMSALKSGRVIVQGWPSVQFTLKCCQVRALPGIVRRDGVGAARQSLDLHLDTLA